MKKFLLVRLLWLRSLLLRRPPISRRALHQGAAAMIAAVYDWSGFYIGVNGGWGSSHKCWDFETPAGAFIAAEGCHDATGGTAGGQIGYRWQSGTWVFGLEAQGNWADFKGSNVSLLSPALSQPVQDRCVRPVHRPGRLCRQQRAVLRQGRRCCRRRIISEVLLPSRPRWSPPPATTPAGAPRSAPARIRLRPELVVGVEYDHLFLRIATINFFNGAGAFVGAPSQRRIRQDVDLVTVRVNYRWVAR